ncbi:phage holin family protein [uncultured Enterovirga sp.]|uniref:phage holin family protein n=1 Tax=uncultured Enterovirga sp. TaxID=2026352 RepID=UPI0035CBDED4
MADRSGTATLQELVGDALRDGADLARKEFGLFRAEMASNASGLAKAAIMFLIAAVFAVASLIWLTQALVYGLDVLLHRPWLSALIVGAALAIIAGVLAFIGKNMISATSLAPNRTLQSLKRDGEVLTERTIG